MTTNLKIETAANGDVWVECTACGAGDWQSVKKTLAHRRICRTREQYGAVAVEVAKKPVLQTFADNVRRTGLTKGRDEDVFNAVRGGYLSESDAMNVDD